MLLKRRGARLTFSDPHVPVLELEGEHLKSQDTGLVASADCTVVVTDHAEFDYRDFLLR